jgi:hypothetical protein
MDLNRFDCVSESLADTSLKSRRGVFAALGVAVLGVLAGVDADATSAKRKLRRHTKRKSGHESKPNNRDGSARPHAAKRRKHGRKRGPKGGQRDGQEQQGSGVTTAPPDGTGGGGCTSLPKSLTCAGLCGMTTDNCGYEVDCGQCSGPDGPSECVSPPLTTTCHGQCGLVGDYCARQVDCGPCDGGCTSQDQAITCAGNCGTISDNCGREVSCGLCDIGCASVPWATTCAGKCGLVTDICGLEVNCGNTCSGLETCGGGDTSSVCGCTSQPKTVTCRGRCGKETDNCGRQVDCGTCPVTGCFIEGTRVRMADGSDRAIELVEPGDRVLGRGGRINQVRGVLYPVLGDRKLYALNGGIAFVTASHPFLTTEGWKAVDPDAARAEVPGLRIERLTVGDVLLAATAAATAGRNAERNTDERATDVEELEVSLHSLDGRVADSATQLYNLDVDGDDTYVANGLVVHNKVF